VITSMEEVRALSKPEDPMHPLIFQTNPQILASNHIVDYTRVYIMKHYGGGYLDVKPMFHSWKKWFDKFDNDPDLWHVAPRVRADWDVCCNESYLVMSGLQPVNCDALRDNWHHIGSDACWITRPYTPLTIEAHRLVNGTLNEKWQDLLVHHVPQKWKHRCCAGWGNPNWKWQMNKHPDYALRWTEMHGEAFDMLQVKYHKHISVGGLPRYDEKMSYH
jgi:hypothetical protein